MKDKYLDKLINFNKKKFSLLFYSWLSTVWEQIYRNVI
jgi:hypothetical protein